MHAEVLTIEFNQAGSGSPSFVFQSFVTGAWLQLAVPAHRVALIWINTALG